VVPTGYVSGHDRKGTHRWRASNSLKVIINYIEQKRQELYEKNRQDPAQASGSV
jgi:phosphate-selective porin